MKMLLGAAAASRAAPQSIVVVPSPINESQWDGPSSTLTVTFGPRYLTADASNNNAGSDSLIRQAASKSTGKFYAEFLLSRLAASYLPALGIISEIFYPFRSGVGVSELGGAGAWTLRANGDLYAFGSVTSGYTPAFIANDVMTLAVDLVLGRLWFGRNGTWVGSPSANTAPAFSNLISVGGSAQAGGGALATIAGTIGYVNGGADYGALTARFKAADWQYAPPTGFGEWTP